MTTPTAVERWKEAEPSLRAEHMAELLEDPDIRLFVEAFGSDRTQDHVVECVDRAFGELDDAARGLIAVALSFDRLQRS
jgi:hypothetical protein